LHYKRRSSLLVNGFIRRSQGTYDVVYFPSDIAKIVIDMYSYWAYWALHNEWLSQNIIIQMVNPDSNEGEPVYLNGSVNKSKYASFNVAHDYDFKFPSVAADAYNCGIYFGERFFSPIWRMYFDEDSEGFMIRAADIASTEDLSEWTSYLRIGQRAYGERDKPKGIIFRLLPTQRPHEYYIQRLEDGQYLSIKYGPDVRYALYPEFAARHGHSRDIRLKSMGFEESSSAATLFRFRAYHHPLDQWRKQLSVGHSVLYRKHGRDWVWVNGKVIATKHNGFGTEIKVKYKGIIGGGHWDDCDLFTTPTSCHCNYGKVQRVQGEIWLPVESNLISNPSSIDPSILENKPCKFENHNGENHIVLREEDYNERDFLPPKPEPERDEIDSLYGFEEQLYFKPEPERIEIGQIGDLRIGRPVPDGTHDVEYEKKRKSKKRRRGKKRKHNYGNWKRNDKLRKKVIERKSQKYGLIQKYELYL